MAKRLAEDTGGNRGRKTLHKPRPIGIVEHVEQAGVEHGVELLME